MAIPITIPRLGWNMEEGTFAGWLKQDGDPIRPGDMLFSLEGEKATEEIECLDAGILRIPANGPNVGDVIAVGAVIGHLDNGVAEPVEPVERVESSRPAEVDDGEHRQLVSPYSPTEEAAEPTAENGTKTISPRARRTAQELGIDWTTIEGSGQTGRIRERDVRSAVHDDSKPTPIPHAAIRKTIAERMLASHRDTAPVTLTTTVDASNLVNLRNQFKAVGVGVGVGSEVPSFTDFLCKLTGIALQKHPALHSTWSEQGIVPSPAVHIGIAVDTEAGLLVPVVRDVLSLGIKEIASQSRELIERARNGKLSADKMRGGTFTITNLGAFGVETFTPIINQPECAILGVGRIQPQPVVINGQIVVRERMFLSLTFDHRIVDGAPAARFLQTLTVLIENPGPGLM